MAFAFVSTHFNKFSSLSTELWYVQQLIVKQGCHFYWLLVLVKGFPQVETSVIYKSLIELL